ncbi:hypothetical protein VUR80DRAFT_9489 [Thermomyces stellatus]
MKGINVVPVTFAVMASAILPPDFQSALSKASSLSSATLGEYKAPEATRNPILTTTNATSSEFLNQTIRLDQRSANKQAGDEEFDCSGVRYFVPEIEVECVVNKRPTEASWYYKLNVKIQPAGLAYSNKGLERWYKPFLESFLDGWNYDTFEPALTTPDKWQTTWKHGKTGENNWGWGLWVESTETDSLRSKDDPRIEEHMAEHFGRIIPKAVCGDDAGGIKWKHEEQCKITKDDDKKEEEKKKDDKKDEKKEKDEKKDDTTNDEGFRPPRPGGGYRGREP